MIFNPTHFIIETGEKVELLKSFPNDCGTICICKKTKEHKYVTEYVSPEELEFI